MAVVFAQVDQVALKGGAEINGDRVGFILHQCRPTFGQGEGFVR